MSASKTLLLKHNLRKTPFRLKVLELFLETPHAAMNNTKLESRLGAHDRITLYRTLKSFEDKGLVHQVHDGSNELKYALCHDGCKVHTAQQDHAHFRCETCDITYCLDTVSDVNINIPENYTLKKVNLALTGTCANCNKGNS